MKRLMIVLQVLSTLFLSSCVTYTMISKDESFDALTKITDGKKVCALSSGGDYGKNLIFCAKEEDGSYNIYLKDNVLSSALTQKTDGKNFNISPNYNKTTEKIVFQYLTRTNFDIYYISSNKGKAITQVTSTDENEYNPCWSSDGKMIVFEKGISPKYYIKYSGTSNATIYKQGVKVTENQIWIKNLETGELKMIGQGSYPKFSPKNDEILYVKYDLNRAKTAETGTICIMSIDGENQRQITNVDLGYATCPNWSPDGKNIIFQLTKKNKLDSDIYTIGIDGENLKQHTANTSNDFAPNWTEDNFIYFTSDRGAQAGKYQIWRFKIAL